MPILFAINQIVPIILYRQNSYFMLNVYHFMTNSVKFDTLKADLKGFI